MASKAGFGSVSAECAHLFSESAQDGDKVILLASFLAPFLIYIQASEYAGAAFTMLNLFASGLDHEVEKLSAEELTPSLMRLL